MDTCDVAESIFTDGAKWNETFNKYISDDLMKNSVYTCMYGDGSLSSILPTSDSLDGLNEMDK